MLHDDTPKGTLNTTVAADALIVRHPNYASAQTCVRSEHLPVTAKAVLRGHNVVQATAVRATARAPGNVRRGAVSKRVSAQW